MVVSQQNSSTPFELTDIPRVAGTDLHAVIGDLVAAGHANFVFGNVTDEDRAQFTTTFWQTYSGDTGLGAAILIRFWALVDVLASRRMQALLLDRGFSFLRLAAQAAAKQRLNAQRGLNPLQMMWAVQALEQKQQQDDHRYLQPPVISKPVARPIAPMAA